MSRVFIESLFPDPPPLAPHDDEPVCRLVHLTGPRKSAVDTVSTGFVRLGRGADNDVAFDAFAVRTVSARHAGVRREGGAFVLYDMGSLNGTWLNGLPVGRSVLADGDEIALGRHGPRLRVRIRDAVRPAAGPTPRTGPHPPLDQELRAMASIPESSPTRTVPPTTTARPFPSARLPRTTAGEGPARAATAARHVARRLRIEAAMLALTAGILALMIGRDLVRVALSG